MADVESLLAPVSDDNPVGDDLSYDTERQEIEAAFERSASGSAANEGEVDWRSIVRLIEGQGQRTKDLWLAVYMARAGVKMAQLDVVERGTAWLAGLLSTYWDKVHPQLDEYGFQGRKTPLESLKSNPDFLIPLKSIILIRHPRLGEYSSGDLERFAADGESADGYGMFRAALAEVPPEDLFQVRAQIESIGAALRVADKIMTDNAGGETSVSFQPTYDALTTISRNLAFFTGGDAATEDAPAAEDEVSAPAGGGAGRSGGKSGAVESREDVLRALDVINDYYRRREPASPVPLALARAREWVTMDFMSVMEDIAPGSMTDIKYLLMSTRAREGG